MDVVLRVTFDKNGVIYDESGEKLKTNNRFATLKPGYAYCQAKFFNDTWHLGKTVVFYENLPDAN
jgi:hypothetical protein